MYIKKEQLFNYFSEYSPDLELVINNKIFKCNINSAKCFSTLISEKNIIDNRLNIEINCNIKGFEDIISFFNGNFILHEENINNLYELIAIFDIKFLYERIKDKYINYLNINNFIENINRIHNYSFYLKPFFEFLIQKNENFEILISNNLFPNSFLILLFHNYSFLFQNEDQKVNFLLKYLSNETKPNFNLFSTINNSLVSNNSLKELFLNQKIKKIRKNMSLFINIQNLNNFLINLKFKLKIIKNLINLMNYFDSLASEFSLLIFNINDINNFNKNLSNFINENEDNFDFMKKDIFSENVSLISEFQINLHKIKHNFEIEIVIKTDLIDYSKFCSNNSDLIRKMIIDL